MIHYICAGVPSAAAGVAGRFAVNIAYNLGMQFAAELLPTVARAQGLGLVHIAGYIATVLVPYIIYMVSFFPFFHPPIIIIRGKGPRILRVCI